MLISFNSANSVARFSALMTIGWMSFAYSAIPWSLRAGRNDFGLSRLLFILTRDHLVIHFLLDWGIEVIRPCCYQPRRSLDCRNP